MGVNFLKRLIQEAKSANDVITLEATVITGFEGQAVDECREKCKPLNCGRAKGRIFFNIKKDSFPNVLKMRSIDNVFLVLEAFEEMKFKKVKDEDLLAVKNLVDKVDWNKSVPEWAEIIGFKGVQFPKCAQNDHKDLSPLDENEPVCQGCLNPKNGGGGDLLKNEDGAGSHTDNGSSSREPIVRPKVGLISDKEVFQTPPDKCAMPECKNSGCIKDYSTVKDGIERSVDKNDLSLESLSTGVHPLAPEESDDESAFHSAEEDGGLLEQPIISAALVVPVAQTSPEVDTKSASEDRHKILVPVDEISCHDGSSELGSHVVDDVVPEQAKRERNTKDKRGKRRGRREAKRNSIEVKSEVAGAAKLADGKGDPGCESLVSSPPESKDAVPNKGSEPAEGPVDQSKAKDGKKKSYWQKRREAKAKKDAESKAAKPPRKAYVNDGIMKFRVTCYRNGPKHSFDSNDAAGHFGGFINDKFHWTVDLTRYDINVVLVIEEDSAYVTLALTNKSLHKRNIKHFGPTTLRATLCYGLLRLAEPRVGDIVMDPMCGGGSIPIEGALAFPGTYYICGDVNGKCVAMTGDNIVHNSKDKPLLVDALQWSVRRLPLQDQSVDVFVTDLPFGLRVGKQKDNTGLYIAALNEAARVVRLCGRASLLTYDRTAMIRALQRTRHLWREVRVNLVNQVLDLAFDSVGARLAAAEGNGHVQVWDARKGPELLFCLSGHTCEVSKVCFSPGGGQVLTASSDGTARLWSAKDGRLLQILDGHSDEVFSCAFSYSGESILTASKDKTCRLWKRQPIIEQE